MIEYQISFLFFKGSYLYGYFFDYPYFRIIVSSISDSVYRKHLK